MPFSNALFNRLTSASPALTDRQRARLTSERVNSGEDDEETGAAEELSPSRVSLVGNHSTTTTTTTTQEEEEAGGIAEESSALNVRSNTGNNNSNGNANSNTIPTSSSDGTAQPSGDEEAPVSQSNNTLDHEEVDWEEELEERNTMTLAELEEERELARRRMSACVLLTVFVLFKLWIDCIEQPSLPLLMICLIGTSWTARWIRYNREREEELDRRIAHYLQTNQQQRRRRRSASGNDEEDEIGIMDRHDLRMLSFQAQLALAIMESQRHMMEGGRPDSEHQTPGVSDAAKQHWQQIVFHDDAAAQQQQQQYGSVKDVDGPHCSICLCEYEEGDKLTKLPCQHLYHAECIDSWTSNHTKCPLCNFELESLADGTATAAAETNIV